MTIGEYLALATRQLEAAGIPTARLDCLVLMEDVLNTNRTRILAEPNLLMTNKQLEKLHKLIGRRVAHEPLAYIRNKTEFYGREFYIDHRVLEPRAESETMIDLLKALPLPTNTTIVDVGTGSGALAVTAKLELPEADVVGTDIDEGCISIAFDNACALEAAIELLHGNLLEPLEDFNFQATVFVLCNLPYVPDSFQINPAAMREPHLAIFGGPDGLDLYRQLFNQLHVMSARPIYILTEAMPPQHPALAEIAQATGYRLETASDFIQVFVPTKS